MKVATISRTNFQQAIAIAQRCRNIELRLAQLELSNEEIVQVIETADTTILTGLTDKNIIPEYLFSKIIIDFPFPQSVAPNPKSRSILSFHSYDKHIKIERIIPNIEKTLAACGNNINKYTFIKIAILVNKKGKLKKLLKLLCEHKYLHNNLIIVPLGEKFSIERYRSMFLGSKMMFFYADVPVAKGQRPYRKF